jgi:hypothetical protein
MIRCESNIQEYNNDAVVAVVAHSIDDNLNDDDDDQSSFASTPPSVTNVPFISLDVSLVEAEGIRSRTTHHYDYPTTITTPTTTRSSGSSSSSHGSDMIPFRCHKNVITTKPTTSCGTIPTSIYIPHDEVVLAMQDDGCTNWNNNHTTTTTTTTTNTEHGEIYDPTEVLRYEQLHDLVYISDAMKDHADTMYQLLQQYMQQPDQISIQNDIVTHIQQYPETCQIRYTIPTTHTVPSDDGTSSNRIRPLPTTSWYPFTYFCSTNWLVGVQTAYDVYPEVVGCMNDPTTLGYLPLACACAYGSNVATVQFLLSVFPDAVRRTSAHLRQTPLHLLCQSNTTLPDPTIVRLLLEHYPTAAQLPDRNGYTPVMYLCQNPQWTGTNKNLQTCTSTSTIMILELLFGTCPLTVSAVTTHSMEKLLHIACFHNIHEYNLIQYILAEDPNQCQYTDLTFQLPLHKAVQGYCNIILSHGPPPTILSPHATIPHAAIPNATIPTAAAAALRTIQCLVDAYPDAVQWRDDHDETPMEIVNRLLATTTTTTAAANDNPMNYNFDPSSTTESDASFLVHPPNIWEILNVSGDRL